MVEIEVSDFNEKSQKRKIFETKTFLFIALTNTIAFERVKVKISSKEP